MLSLTFPAALTVIPMVVEVKNVHKSIYPTDRRLGVDSSCFQDTYRPRSTFALIAVHNAQKSGSRRTHRFTKTPSS